MFSDNVLQDGDIIESRFAVERRNRTIHSENAGVSVYPDPYAGVSDTAVVPIGDGVALSVKR